LPDLPHHVWPYELWTRQDVEQQLIAKQLALFDKIREYDYEHKVVLEHILTYYNETLLEQKLPLRPGFLKVAFDRVKYSRLSHTGRTHWFYDLNKVSHAAGITINVNMCENTAEVVATLLHECVHAYLIEQQVSHEGHEQIFASTAQQFLNKLQELNFPISAGRDNQGDNIMLPPAFRNLRFSLDDVLGDLSNEGKRKKMEKNGKRQPEKKRDFDKDVGIVN